MNLTKSAYFGRGVAQCSAIFVVLDTATPRNQAFWLQVKIKLNIQRTDKGVRVVATGGYMDTIETTLVPPERIGRFVADLILDRAYLKGAQIVINNAIAFEAFDANEDFDAFVKHIDAV
ncbi:hypothetical protein [Rhizobium sp. CCGE532]|uniref:hypothetical protein n=1 Tax=Rhizobium sp. CCGE532 TaxID=2364272 RepID=UPI000EA94E8E|nr:hypothetical protein [Rhizobium sp. CCGE532]AYG73607.1 hypothetical protein CCGE532_14725 [Rhizobium sp. CCGE532]